MTTHTTIHSLDQTCTGCAHVTDLAAQTDALLAIKAVRDLAAVGDAITDRDKREAFFDGLTHFISIAQVGEGTRARMRHTLANRPEPQYATGDPVEVQSSPDGWERATYARQARLGESPDTHAVTMVATGHTVANIHPDKIRPVPRGWDHV